MKSSILKEIAKKHGSPIYIYDAEKIENQYLKLKKAFSEVKELKIYYAAKALTNISILKFISRLGSGLDTVSCLLYTSPSPRDKRQSRMPSSA